MGKKNIAGPRLPAGKQRAGARMLPVDVGKLVDEQITHWTRHGAESAQRHVWSTGKRGLHEATKTLIRHVTEEKRWVPVAAQVPLLMPSVAPRVATAVDLLCTDAATRKKLFLVEIKTTQERQPGAADACYRAAPLAPARVRGDAQKMAQHVPRSQYATHQGQLWCMDLALRSDFNVTPDASYVFRTRPGKIDEYPLDRTWWDANRDEFLLQIARPMLRRERQKRRERQGAKKK